MKHIVSCPACPKHVSSTFPDLDGAQAYVRRHHIVGDKHRAVVETVLETPHEGLIQ